MYEVERVGRRLGGETGKHSSHREQLVKDQTEQGGEELTERNSWGGSRQDRAGSQREADQGAGHRGWMSLSRRQRPPWGCRHCLPGRVLPQ